jgi:hypothetical protein
MTNIQGIRKSASAYMSKYMSKSRSDMEDLQRQGVSLELPSTWVMCSRQMRLSIASKTLYFVGAQAEQLLARLKYAASSFIAWSMPVHISLFEGLQVKIGEFGQLSRRGLLYVRSARSWLPSFVTTDEWLKSPLSAVP